MQKIIKVIHANRTKAFREGLKKQLEEKYPITIICVSSVKEIFQEVSNCNPDILITDWRLHDNSSFYFLPIIKAQFPELKIIMLTMRDDKEFFEECKAYCSCIVSTTSTLDEIANVIRNS